MPRIKEKKYSRYYHLLETLVRYDYPESEGKGHISSKKAGERFSSEFFSKTKRQNRTSFREYVCNYPVERLDMRLELFK